jgi:hypothetical protein
MSPRKFPFFGRRLMGLLNVNQPQRVLKAFRRAARIIGLGRSNHYNTPLYSQGVSVFERLLGPEAERHIESRLRDPGPLMIARFGNSEADLLANLRVVYQSPWRRNLDYLRGRNEGIFTRNDVLVSEIKTLSGFFPTTPPMLRQFYELCLEDMGHCDVLGSWLGSEKAFFKELRRATKVGLEDVSGCLPLTEKICAALKGKRVLVVHPFVESIQRQHQQRQLVWAKCPGRVPDFHMEILKPVQSFADMTTQFGSWFEALEHMKVQIDRADFDLAILGCGAYGFNLAAHIKRTGRKAWHMGGAVQLIFGIIGQRWERIPEYAGRVSEFRNKYWVRPLETERPTGHEKVDGAGYW